MAPHISWLIPGRGVTQAGKEVGESRGVGGKIPHKLPDGRAGQSPLPEYVVGLLKTWLRLTGQRAWPLALACSQSL